ncbi:MAG: Hpt domain-containing protein, partial [Verrucomicrobia bacterium]
ARRATRSKKKTTPATASRQEELFPAPGSDDSQSPDVQLAHVAEEMGLTPEEAADRLAGFAQAIQRHLRDLKEALEDGQETEARELAHTIAEAAAEHNAPDLRRAAKTVELAIRYQESRLPAMVAELEAEIAHTVSVIDGLTALPPAPVEPLRVSRAIFDTLEQLAEVLEDEDGEAALEGVDTLLEQTLPDELTASLREIRELIAETEWPEALSRIRGWLDRLGSPDVG